MKKNQVLKENFKEIVSYSMQVRTKSLHTNIQIGEENRVKITDKLRSKIRSYRLNLFGSNSGEW